MLIDRLIGRIIEKRNPTVAGLDPRPEYIPAHIIQTALNRQAEPFAAMAEAFFMFNTALIDALCDIVPAVKPQIAFYEQLGPAGMECYINTLRYAKTKGLITIGDAKRGDIPSTARAYADAHIGRVTINGQARPVYDADFITVNPYMGYDSVGPFIENAKAYDKGVFVLVKTSNAGAGGIQDIQTENGLLYEAVADKTAEWGAGLIGEYGYSQIGAVVGATRPEAAAALRKRLPNVFFLVPGYGAQGGGAESAKAAFTPEGLGAVVNSSRGIISAYRQPPYSERFTEKEFALAARQAAIDMRDALGFAYEAYC